MKTLALNSIQVISKVNGLELKSLTFVSRWEVAVKAFYRNFTWILRNTV